MEKIKIRPQVRADIEQFYQWERTPEVSRFFSIADDQPMEEVMRTFEEIENDPEKAGFTIMGEDGRRLGRIYLAGISRKLDSLEIYRIYIGDPAERNKGYGRQALLWILDRAFRQDSFHRIYLDYYDGNPAQYLYESVGFRHEGKARGACKKMEEYHDVNLMAILREDYEAIYGGGAKAEAPENALQPEDLPDTVAVAEGAVITGDVAFGRGCSVWYNAVIRGDNGPVRIGDDTNIQDGCVIHVNPGGTVRIGSGVSIGHGAIVHGATIGDGTLIGMGAIVMEGARIGRDSLVAAGALVTGGRSFPDGMLILGSPAKAVRPLTEEELASVRFAAEEYREAKKRLTTVPR